MLSEQGQAVCNKLETKCSAMLDLVTGAAKVIMGNTEKTRQLESYIRDRQQDVHETKARLDAAPVARKMK